MKCQNAHQGCPWCKDEADPACDMRFPTLGPEATIHYCAPCREWADRVVGAIAKVLEDPDGAERLENAIDEAEKRNQEWES